MKKVFKWIGIILGTLLIIGIITVLIMSEPVPEGKEGAAADELAQCMEKAINKTAWDSTRYVQWTFSGIHDYVWNKEAHIVEVKWSDYRVLFRPDELKGKAWKNGQSLSEEDAQEKVQKAWSFFANDSFWLNAPAKVFDPGTRRSLVKTEEGNDALLISYDSGGVTPGDQYLWLLDENCLPYAWKMWVKIVPIEGIETTWAGWQTLSTGALISTEHSLKGLPVEVTNVKGAQSLVELGLEENLFVEID